MRRRNLLALATGACCGLAGCVDSRFDRLQSNRSSGDGSSDGTDRDAGESGATDAIVVGDPDAVPFLDAHPPHEFKLRNDGEVERTVSVVVSVDADDEGDERNGPLLERDLTLAADEARTIVLVEPRSYVVTVATSSDDGTSESTVTDGVSRRPFDCTRSRTTVALAESGVRTESTTSSIPCPVPEVADASLAVDEQECAGRTDGDDATVAFADEAVHVDGAITTPTPCHTVSLGDVTYDERRDRLAITVTVGEQESGICVDCLGIVDYEARIDLEGRYPARVAVVHQNGDETRQVATAECTAE